MLLTYQRALRVERVLLAASPVPIPSLRVLNVLLVRLAVPALTRLKNALLSLATTVAVDPSLHAQLVLI